MKGRTKVQTKQVFILRLCRSEMRKSSYLAGSSMVGFAEGRIEAAHTPKTCRQGNLAERQIGFVNELFGEMQAPRVGNRNRTGAKMPHEKSSQLPRANPQTRCERVYSRIFQ